MKCRTCCFDTILDPKINSIHSCVRLPPTLQVNEYGNLVSMCPKTTAEHWCGEWKPEGFIKIWPENLTKEY